MSFNITIREFTANVAANTFGGVAEVPVANLAGFLLDAGDGLKPATSATVRFGFWSFPYNGAMIAKVRGAAPNVVPKTGELVPVSVLIGGDWKPATAILPVGIRSSMASSVAGLWTAALAGGPTEVKDATGIKRTAATPTANPAAVAAANQELTELKALVAAQADRMARQDDQLSQLMAMLAAAAAPKAEAEAPKADAKATTTKK